jgi:hypothetical protein
MCFCVLALEPGVSLPQLACMGIGRHQFRKDNNDRYGRSNEEESNRSFIVRGVAASGPSPLTEPWQPLRSQHETA